MGKGKTSFIVVNWNGKDTVEECLNSILAQTCRNYEIIFVDNHSEDGSAELVKEKYDIEKLILLEKNYGYAEANNIAFSAAEGKYIALVNNDAVLDRNWLEKALDVFHKNEYRNAGSVATKNIYYHQRNTIDTAGVEFFGFGAGWDYKGLPADSPEVNQRKEVFGACATAALYKKKTIDELGLFDPRYFIYFEDTDLAFRLRLFGYACIYEPEAVCYHHGGVKRKKNSPFYIDFGRRNIEFLFFKNMQGYLLAKYFPGHCLYESLLFVLFLYAGKGIPFLRAKINFLKNFAYILGERKKLKSHLIKSGQFRKIKKVEIHFLRSNRGLWDKVKKGVRTYSAYMNIE